MAGTRTRIKKSRIVASTNSERNAIILSVKGFNTPRERVVLKGERVGFKRESVIDCISIKSGNEEQAGTFRSVSSKYRKNRPNKPERKRILS